MVAKSVEKLAQSKGTNDAATVNGAELDSTSLKPNKKVRRNDTKSKSIANIANTRIGPVKSSSFSVHS